MVSIIFYVMLFLVIPLGLFILFGWLVNFHLLRYGLDGSYNKKAALIFTLGLIAISIMVAQRFFMVDWKKVSLQKFIETSTNNFINDYER